jgi:hypothetical protein
VTDADLDRLVDQFRAATLPATDWTHRAHLAVGTWHVFHHGADAALDVVREGILRLNDQHGTPNTDSRGYHETITRAYLMLIGDVLARTPQATPADAAARVLQDPMAVPGALLTYYTKDRLMSVAARRAWVEPDLRPLPDSASRPTVNDARGAR